MPAEKEPGVQGAGDRGYAKASSLGSGAALETGSGGNLSRGEAIGPRLEALQGHEIQALPGSEGISAVPVPVSTTPKGVGHRFQSQQKQEVLSMLWQELMERWLYSQMQQVEKW